MKQPRKKYNWPGVKCGSPEYYRLWREANADQYREYKRGYDSKMYKEHPKREYDRRRRWIVANRDKANAHQAVRRAIISGRLVKEPCSVCNDSNSIAHHPDYSKRLEVVWLCEIHHKVIHTH